jgi:hypothetical protein
MSQANDIGPRLQGLAGVPVAITQPPHNQFAKSYITTMILERQKPAPWLPSQVGVIGLIKILYDPTIEDHGDTRSAT